jgi:D-serine deaminase-like pyridoxal phosphate-dependent protein
MEPFFGAAKLNAPLLGSAGGRLRLETPAALLDIDDFEHNLTSFATGCGKYNVGMRPHAKSHKCAEIARRQVASGALGVCCAKSGELLALHQAGIQDLLLTAPMASTAKIDLLAQAAARHGRVGVVVDRHDLAKAYGAAARNHGVVFDCLVDLDIGLNRSGVGTPEEAAALAKTVQNEEGLRYRGVQAYQGRVQHVTDFASRRATNHASAATLKSFLDLLRRRGLAPEIVSGGGTGSHLLDGEEQMLTEIQAGSYVFMDEGYREVDIDGSGTPPFRPALRVAVTVIGHSSTGFAIVDGGSKSFALDGPAPYVLLEGKTVGRIEWCGDEFGRVIPAEGNRLLPVGTVVECTVPHCDPTINLHDFLHVVQGGRLIDIWRVEGRGRAE